MVLYRNSIQAFNQLEPLTQFLLWIMLFLLVPVACERINIPGVLGFILLGWALGPQGIGLLDPDALISRICSELGVGLLLFFVGFEIDFSLLKRARLQVAFFGLATFTLPLATGFLVAQGAGFSVNASLLIGSLLASHTLLAYSVVQRAGLVGRLSVVATAGATVFTDIAAMIVLAVCLLIHKTGFSEVTILRQLAEIMLFVPLMIFGGSWLIRQVAERFHLRGEMQLLLFFLLVAGGHELATVFGLDGIVGAFMAGIAARRAIRVEQPVHVLKTVSNTFLIPGFFIATGMLIQPAVLLDTIREQPVFAFGLTFALLAGKFIAAWLTGKVFGYSKAEIGLTFSLTLPQVAATLAATTVAYRTLNAAHQPLIPHSVLNAVLVLVVLTSIGGPLLTQRYVRRLAADAGGSPAAQTRTVTASAASAVPATPGDARNSPT